MTDDAETVTDVLRDMDGGRSNCKLLAFVNGHLAADQLGYEDWVRPMKLTGGRVCLRCDFSHVDLSAWVCRDGDGTLTVHEETRGVVDTGGVGYVKSCLDQSSVTVTPVLRGDTPFSED